jgi:hypothetical protein
MDMNSKSPKETFQEWLILFLVIRGVNVVEMVPASLLIKVDGNDGSKEG